MARNKGLTQERVAEAWRKHGSVKAVAEELGVYRSTIQFHLKRMGVTTPLAEGFKTGQVKETKAELPSRGVRRYILTSAQNNTWVHKELFENLKALAEHYGDCQLWVSCFTYNLSAYKAQPVKETVAPGEPGEVWYDPVIEAYRNDDRVELAPGLVWCGEVNILPTAERPLRGFESYTGRSSGIFPHAKLAMDSIASGKNEATKFNYTTGAVTQMNYLQRKAGQKAEFHHCYGALLVEVDADGHWWVRQLNADSKGVLHDLDLCVEGGQVTEGVRVEAINWGDIHEEQLDPDVRRLAWASGGMLDTLRPKNQFMHDTLSFVRRNHHDRGDPHKRFRIFIEGRDSVAQEVERAAVFLDKESARSWCQTIVVSSNHDNALDRWLREGDYKTDPANAVFFLRTQLAKYRSIQDGDDNFHTFEHVCRELGVSKSVRFLREDESFVVCKSGKSGSGIECGMHGHNGPNGARGAPLAFARMGRRANIGHIHTTCIVDGLYASGTSSQLDLGYNVGPSSWSHSHIVTYANGKRAIVTMYAGKWRA